MKVEEEIPNVPEMAEVWRLPDSALGLIAADQSEPKASLDDAFLFIIPGLGQIYNKQYLKGAAFLVFGLAFIFTFKDLLNMGYWGIFTLGEQTPRDNSIFFLAQGIIAVILTVLGLTLYYFIAKDAYQNGKHRDRNEPLHCVQAQCHYLRIMTCTAHLLLT